LQRLLAIGLPHAAAQDRWGYIGSRSRGSDQRSASATWCKSGWLRGDLAAHKEWRLGIDGDRTETGVVVRTVTRQSAAQKERIEVGDVIVAVEGFQVGLVSGRYYDLRDELNRRADPAGRVTMLVQDNISGQLASIRAQ